MDKLTEAKVNLRNYIAGSIKSQYGGDSSKARAVTEDIMETLDQDVILMEVDEVQRDLDKIRETDNPVYAHRLEDDLWLRVLMAIAGGECESPATIAEEAIKSQQIEFPRLYSDRDMEVG